ncbi:MAG TPA: hypothetical protein VII23_24085 [Terriglobales bacterium]
MERELWYATQLLPRSRGVRHTPRARKSAASPLTGRLFDESGQSLTPSHAVKGQRRYRYYVSRSLIKGTADSTGRGWRLPAPEIEPGDKLSDQPAAMGFGAIPDYQQPARQMTQQVTEEVHRLRRMDGVWVEAELSE